MRRNGQSAHAGRRAQLLGFFVACAATALPTGCATPPATAIDVSVKTDLVIGRDLVQVTYRIFAAKADPDDDVPVSEFTVDAQQLEMPFVITQREADEFLLSVEGVGVDLSVPVIVYRERVKFEKDKTLALHIFLARSCFHKPCSFDGLTCYGETFGQTQAGQCGGVPGPRTLKPVERPGDESMWEPTPSHTLDAGSSAPPPPWSPTSGGGLCRASLDGGLCTPGR